MEINPQEKHCCSLNFADSNPYTLQAAGTVLLHPVMLSLVISRDLITLIL
jgi:hypothetical protein